MKAYEQIAERLYSLNHDEVADESVKIDIEGDENSLDGILLVLTIPYQSFFEEDEDAFKIISLSNSLEHAEIEISDGEDSNEEFSPSELQEKVKRFIEMRRKENENPSIRIIVSNEAHGIRKLTPLFTDKGLMDFMSRKDLMELVNSKWLGKNNTATKIKVYLDKNKEKFNQNIYESIRGYLIENLYNVITANILFKHLDRVKLECTDEDKGNIIEIVKQAEELQFVGFYHDEGQLITIESLYTPSESFWQYSDIDAVYLNQDKYGYIHVVVGSIKENLIKS